MQDNIFREGEGYKMDKLAKAGSILVIIASALMVILSLFVIFIGGFAFLAVGVWLITILAVIIFAFTVVNIVLASLVLAGRHDLIIPAGIIAVLSVVVAWVAWGLPAILFLVGGILLFCHKKPEVKKEQIDELKATELLAV